MDRRASDELSLKTSIAGRMQETIPSWSPRGDGPDGMARYRVALVGPGAIASKRGCLTLSQRGACPSTRASSCSGLVLMLVSVLLLYLLP